MQDEPAIFISYRRRDAGGHGRALHEYLSRRFGDDRVFFDRSTIESGDVFPDRLRRGVEGCAALLALIGPEWLDVRGNDGDRRLDDADDFVRREIALALEQGKKVIPVLFDDTPVPPRDRLPDPLKALASYDALTLRGKTYEYQTQRQELVQLLAKVPGVPQPLPEQPDSNRHKMLAKIRSNWIDGYLKKDSLHNLVRIELGLEEKPDAVSRPWDLIVQQPDRAPRPLPPGQVMGAIFDDLGEALLILGAPGAGKTTLLLELARDLLDRAVEDATHPIPVVFHLSSWAVRRRPLADWLVDELRKWYVSRRLAQTWIEGEQVLPLLDGLDEVAPEHRAACVEAINAFRRQYPLVALAVCCRVDDYQALPVRLELSGAIVIQPLSRAQICSYLKQAGKALAGVRTVLRDDETLWQLLETPLMLSIVALAYQGRSAAEVRATGSLEERRTRVFETYTQRMFERRSEVTAYTREQTLRWLTWLARSLMHNNLSVFYMEWMQPNWLPWRSHRWMWGIVSGLSCGILALIMGLVNGLLDEFMKGHQAGLAFHLTVWLPFGLLAGLGAGLAWGWSGHVTPVEALRLSWRKVLVPLIALLGLWLTLGLLGSSISSTRAVAAQILAYGLAFWLALRMLDRLESGLTANQIATRVIPNEGTRRSLRNALISFLSFGLLAGLSIGAASALRFDPTHGLHFDLTYGLTFGVGLGLGFGLMGGLGKGGSAYIKHYVLRILLWHNDYAPWNLVRFLDHAAERVFLRRVGGGYVFVHRLLMEYFAALEQRHLHWNMSRAIVEAMVPVLIVGLVGGIWYWAAWAWMHELSFRPLAERWVYQLRIKKLPLPGLIEIRNGTFMMGGPQEPYGKPVHRVTLSQPFSLGRTEVTFREWDACVADGGCNGYRPYKWRSWGLGTRPVVEVSWEDAQAYAKWLSHKTGRTCRLPSEAEWEYAARAGTATKYALPAPDGSEDIAGKGLANCDGCGSKWDEQTAPVGSFLPNGWGLHDMHGNVEEWVEDCWHESYDGAPEDGRAWLEENGGDCTKRVVRGKTWGVGSATRYWNIQESRTSHDVGFRVLCSPLSMRPDH